MFILDRFDRELRSVKCLDLEFGLSSEVSKFFDKILDCKTIVFFLKISKEIGKAWRKSLARAKLVWGERKKNRLSVFLASLPVSLSILSLVPDLLFDCSRYLSTQKYGLCCSLTKHLLESFLMCSFVCSGFLKRLFVLWHLYSRHFKTSSPSWH